MRQSKTNHAAQIHDEDKLNDYLQRQANIRLVRRNNVLGLIRVVEALGEQLLELESDLDTLALRWPVLAERRAGASRRIWLQWEPPSGGYPLGPVGPSWFEAQDMDPPKRLRRPTRRLLSRTFHQERLEDLDELVWKIHTVREQRETERKRLAGVYRALKGYLENSAEAPRSAPDWVQVRCLPHVLKRAQGLQHLKGGLLQVLREVEELELAMDEAMADINSQGRRRHNVIVAKWSLPPDDFQRTVTGLRGPYFHLLRVGRRGSRRLELIKGKVTRDLIRSCYQTRYEERLLPLVRQVEKQSAERLDLNARLVRVRKILGFHGKDLTGAHDD